MPPVKPDTLYAFTEILEKSYDDDGVLHVKGLATDATLDMDQQRCDPEWLKTAMPGWYEWGNIREMHGQNAVGTAVDMEQKGAGWVIEAAIIDPLAARKVEKGVLRGFSIGIKDYGLDKSAQALELAPKGIINKGDICEISLVDRPSNPNAKLQIAKMVDGELVKSDLDVAMEVETQDECPPCDRCDGIGEVPDPDAEGDNKFVTCPKCGGDGTGSINVLPSLDGGDQEEGAVGEKAADADKVNCPTCKGDGKIMGGNRDCPDCGATGKVTPEKAESLKSATVVKSVDDLPASIREVIRYGLKVAAKVAFDPTEPGIALGTQKPSNTLGGVIVVNTQASTASTKRAQAPLAFGEKFVLVNSDSIFPSERLVPTLPRVVGITKSALSTLSRATTTADLAFSPKAAGLGTQVEGVYRLDLAADATRPDAVLIRPGATVGSLDCVGVTIPPDSLVMKAAQSSAVRGIIAAFDRASLDGETHKPGYIGKADLSTAALNNLPDSDFAYIEPGGAKDSDGKTVPRSKRHFAIHDAAHVRNALARVSQSPFGAKAMPKIKAAAKKFGISVSKAIELLLETGDLTKASGDGQWKHDPAVLAEVRDDLIQLATQELAEFSQGEDERDDIWQLVSALSTVLSWWSDEAAEGEVPPPFTSGDDMSMTALGVSPDLVKAASAESATDEDKTALRDALKSALGVEDTDSIKTSLSEALEKAASLEERLVKVEAMAAPRTISLRAQQQQQSRATEAELLEAEAHRLQTKALTWADPETKKAYNDEANKLLAKVADLRSTL